MKILIFSFTLLVLLFQDECTAQLCVPPGVANGNVRILIINNITTEVTYDCDVGYQLVGAAMLTCTAGVWAPAAPDCHFIPQVTNNNTTTTGFPGWLKILFAVLMTLFCLFLLTLLFCSTWYCCCSSGRCNRSVSHSEYDFRDTSSIRRPLMQDVAVQADFVEYKYEYKIPAFEVDQHVPEEPVKQPQIYRTPKKMSVVQSWMPHSHDVRHDQYHHQSSTK